MPYLSKATIMGHLGRDAETKNVGEKTVTKFSIAVSDGTKDKPHTSWIDVEAWSCPDWLLGGLAKGALVLADGRLKSEEWEKDGVKRTKLKLSCDSFGVKTFEKREDAGIVSQPRPSFPLQQGAISDDEVPF